MQKKIAIAIDGSRNAIEALGYAALLSTHLPDLYFLLIFIHPPISLYLLEEAEKSAKARQALEKIIKANHSTARQMLEAMAERLTAMGVDGDRIELKAQPRMVGAASDILSLCQTHACDALLVGRRGMTRVQEWLTGSVTTNLVEHSQLTPVWVVDGHVTAPKILIAVDGSQGALRALDHLCFILSGAGAAHIHLVHVQPKFSDYCSIDINQELADSAEEIILTGHQHCMDDFYGQARKMMQKNGIEEDHVHLDIRPKHLSTAHTILDALEKGEFGTVVLGRRGISRSVFTGSVSRKVLQKVSDKAVWIVP